MITNENPVLAPLTKGAWDRFDSKMKWDCIVALRGPDCQSSDTIKWFTSAVIRAKMREVMRVGGAVNQSLPFVLGPTSANQIINFQAFQDFSAEKSIPPWIFWSPGHFFGHIYEAAELLGLGIERIEPALYKEIISSHTSRAIKRLAEILPQRLEELKFHHISYWGEWEPSPKSYKGVLWTLPDSPSPMEGE